MDIERVSVELVVLLPFLILGVGLGAAVLSKINPWVPPGLPAPEFRQPPGGHVPDALLVGAWLVATALALWCALVVAFLAIHALFFTFGAPAATIGLVACAVLLAAIPVVGAAVVRRHLHRGRHGRVGGQHA